MKNEWPDTEESGAHDPGQALEAIRRGELDAIVVTEETGTRLYALHPFGVPYQQLFEALPDSALVLDDAGRITFCTPSFCAIVTLPTSDIEQTPLRDLIATTDQSRFDELLASARLANTQAEIGLRVGDGVVAVRIGLSPLPNEYFPDGSDSDQPSVGGFVAIVSVDGMRNRGAQEDRLAGRVQDLASSIVSAREDERAHMSEQMNDVVLPVLNDAELDLEWIEERLRWADDRPHSSVFARLRAVRDQLNDLAARARRYDPPPLRLGLANALEARARQIKARSGVDVHLELALGDRELNRDAQLHLYRLIDQIVMSVAHPSHATEVRIELASDGTTAQLDSRDNGKAIPPARSARHAAALAMINAQVMELSGEVSIRTESDEGTSIRLTIPIADR